MESRLVKITRSAINAALKPFCLRINPKDKLRVRVTSEKVYVTHYPAHYTSTDHAMLNQQIECYRISLFGLRQYGLLGFSDRPYRSTKEMLSGVRDT